MRENYSEAQEDSFGSLTSATAPDSVWQGWYCVRTRARGEHIAAAQLRLFPGTEVFLPRIRYERPMRSTRVWTTEALFPSYLFARFDLSASGRRIRHAHAVLDVVHFGARYPKIPDLVIEELRSLMGVEQTRVIASSFDPGEQVRIAGGPFHDLEAVVLRAMPTQQRVAVLLEFLGRQTTVELDDTQLAPLVERSRMPDLACSAAVFA